MKYSSEALKKFKGTNRLTIEICEGQVVLRMEAASEMLRFEDAVIWILHRDVETYRYALLSLELLENADKIVGNEENRDEPIEHRLIFLLECIGLLRSTGWRFVSRPHLMLELALLCWQLYVCPRDDRCVDAAVAIRVCDAYMEMCEADAFQDWFDRNPPVESCSREQAMEAIADELMKIRISLLSAGTGEQSAPCGRAPAVPIGGSECGRTAVPDDPLKRVEQVLERATAWLLSRYNIEKSLKIVYQDQPFARFVSRWLPELLALMVVAFLACLLKWPVRVKDLKVSPAADFALGTWDALGLSSGLPESLYLLVSFRSGMPLVMTVVYGTLLLAGLWWLCVLKSSGGGSRMQVHLPRMAAGIVVGFLVLLNGDAWLSIFGNKTAFRLMGTCSSNSAMFSWSLFLGRVLVPLGLVYFYILAEMNKVAGIRPNVRHKGVVLWLRGLAYSILIGAIISDLFGESLVRKVLDDLKAGGDTLYALRGWFGLIYPEVICYLSPLAFFIGVFVQLLWEDKALTERI